MIKYVSRALIVTILVFILGRATSNSQSSPNGITSRVSVASDGSQANAGSDWPSISADGNVIAFVSNADNLVSNDTNGCSDIFVHEKQTNTTWRVSISSNGEQGNGESWGANISADGRFVVFTSTADNLVAGDANNIDDVFVHNLQTGETTRVSVATDGSPGNSHSSAGSISEDGRYVAFYSTADNLVSENPAYEYDVFVRDLLSGITERISKASDETEGNRNSFQAQISADGRYVAFLSTSTNLVIGDTNGVSDVFVHDRLTKETTRVSVASDGAQGNGESCLLWNPRCISISPEGRYVAFNSTATNLVGNDTNGWVDVFLHDRLTGQTERISIKSDGTQANGPSWYVSVANNANYIAYESDASNLVPGDTDQKGDILILDRQTDQTNIVSVASSGIKSNGFSDKPYLSSDGRFVVFNSNASNLVSDDTNGFYDIFVHDRGIPTPLPLDLSIDSVLPVQVLEGQDLVKDKATAIKAVIRKSGNGSVGNASARVSINSFATSQFFVADIANTDSQHKLRNDNTSYPLSFGSNEETKTIYFFDNRLAPIDNTYQVSVTVDYAEVITETDETNNTKTMTSPIQVYDTEWGRNSPNYDIRYFRTDWGNTSIPVFVTFYEKSKFFLNSIYPISEQRFKSNRLANYIGDTTPFRLFDGKLSVPELNLWLSRTLIQLRLANPDVDRFVAVVPPGWFAANTTGQLTSAGGFSNRRLVPRLVIAEGRDATQPNSNGSHILAHEIGHTYRLPYPISASGCEEEYSPCNPSIKDGLGNYSATGIWVENRIPIESTINRRVYCFMSGAYSGVFPEVWIDNDDYSKLFNDHKSNTIMHQDTAINTNRAILAVGTIDITDTVELGDWYILQESETDELIPGPYSIEYQDVNGGILFQQSLQLTDTLDNEALTQSPFVLSIPYIDSTIKIVIKHNGIELAEKVVSPNAPIVTVIAPNGNEQLYGKAIIQWSGSDADGDDLIYAVLISSDNGITWEPLVGDLTSTNILWDTSRTSPGTQYLVRVIASDGINTGEDVSNATFTINGQVYLPLVIH